MDYSGIRIGPALLADGVSQAPVRGQREAAEVGANLGGVYEESTVRGMLFSLTMPASTGNAVAAGNIVGASAAASTQFALANPATSNKYLVLLEFCLAFDVSTTAQMPIGPIFHGAMSGVWTAAASAARP